MESSAGIATALCPYIGYKKSAEIAKRALKETRTVRELVLAEKLLSEKELNRVLDPYAMTEAVTEVKAAI